VTIAIALEGVSKRFRIPLDRSTTLKYRMVHWSSSSRYRDLWALHDVTFEVPFGEFIGIIGRNGSGKSTLLKILSRIMRPTTGKVSISGQVSPFLELGVGFNPELSARENIFVNGTILGLATAELRMRVDRILAFAELQDFADQKLKTFSSGMQVRLAFAVAIEADAGILLMDEVLAVGDASFQEKCFDVFARYRREGRTVVLVTHDLGAVENFCNRAILIDHGRVVADGSAVDVTRTYRRLIGEHPARDAVATDSAGTRWGTGDVRIASVELLDGAGRPAANFTTGSPLTIRITYRAAKPIDEVVCEFGLHRSDGVVIAAANSHTAGLTLPPLATDQTASISYLIDSLALLAGTYRLTVELHDRYSSQPFDYVQEGSEFKVHDDNGRAGVFDLAGRWVVDTPQGSTLMPRSA
jgi:ABC-type polysaccharide/polyol phosphate transport system ATPase subunit